MYARRWRHTLGTPGVCVYYGQGLCRERERLLPRRYALVLSFSQLTSLGIGAPVADTDKLRPYQPRPYPNIEGGVPRYTSQEFVQISASISAIREVLKSLEARIVALGG